MKKMSTFLCSFLLLTFSYSVKAQKRPAAKAVFTYTFRIIPSTAKTFGYDIYNENTLYIHQPSIPAMKGTKGFATKVKASKAAQLVLQKIQDGIIPPTITIAELKKIKAI